jgi:urea transport system permease protein
MLSTFEDAPASNPGSGDKPAGNGSSAASLTRSLLAYHRSQTFAARLPDPRVRLLRFVAGGSMLLFFFVVIPLLSAWGVVPDYKLNFLGKHLSLAIVALGIDLIWGYTGLLSLCQAMFFCIGGYVMAMHLSLPQGGGDVRPEYNNIPQFMFFNNVHALPLFWRPLTSMPFTLVAGIALPALAASVFGFFIFRSRVRGVYFSIITQAVAWGAWLLISRNEMLLGGTNGLTNFYKPLTERHGLIVGLYLLTLTTLACAYMICRLLVRSHVGRVLIAVRDKETRLYFAGYQPSAYKVFAFAVGAALAGAGGMLYSPQVTIISPHNMRVAESILMVIWVALGGRGRLWGAIFGALLVNVTLSSLSSDMPAVWLFVQGGMFLGVVLFFPDGFVGLWDSIERQVARGAGFIAVSLTALPLLSVSAFVLAEALGLMPDSLRRVALTTRTIGDVQLKYLVLVVLLAIAAAYHAWARRAAGRRALGTRRDIVTATEAVKTSAARRASET